MDVGELYEGDGEVFGAERKYEESRHVTADHSGIFNQLLQEAVDGIPEDRGPETFEVRFLVDVRHTSPGWVDGYKVILIKR